MSLKAYEDFAPEPLAFPIGGKVYTVPPLGFREGIALQRVLSGDDKELLERPAEDAWRMVLGSAFDAMVADNVPVEALARAGFAALADHQYGREMAVHVWESGIDPKALEAALEASREKVPGVGSTPSPGTGSENLTPSQGSTPSMKSRKKSSPRRSQLSS